ncbi:MAG: hypothetical protein PQJ49_01855 [Sphaerochaetaceae bacterium]|nr:hypothetical protein [Sphaerochaetaceae bacterium]
MAVIILLHAIFRPHLDETSEGDLILWYYKGRTKRDYIVLWKH